MKKFFLLSIFILSFFIFRSQSSTFQITKNISSTVTVNNNDVFYYATSPLTTTDHDFEIKNISNTPQTINIRKYDDLLNTVSAGDIAESHFCTGISCYAAGINSASLALLPNEVVIFKPGIDEASVAGKSEIRYKFSNAANSSESLSFTMKYNTTLSIKKNDVSVINNASAIFPNPTSSKAYINLTSTKNNNNLNYKIFDALGNLASESSFSLTSGDNRVEINTENLNTGIYIVKITDGNKLFTRKIIIN